MVRNAIRGCQGESSRPTSSEAAKSREHRASARAEGDGARVLTRRSGAPFEAAHGECMTRLKESHARRFTPNTRASNRLRVSSKSPTRTYAVSTPS
jgi:hypothetical protein